MGKMYDKYDDVKKIEQDIKIEFNNEMQDKEQQIRNERRGNFAIVVLFIMGAFIVHLVIKECNCPGYISSLIQYGKDNTSDFVDYISDYEYNNNSEKYQQDGFEYATQYTTRYKPPQKILPYNIKEYIDSGYDTTFELYQNDKSGRIVHHNYEISQKMGNKIIRKCGNYYVDANKCVLATIESEYNEKTGLWDTIGWIFYFDGKDTNMFETAKEELPTIIGDENIYPKWCEAVDNVTKSKYMNLEPLDMNKDTKKGSSKDNTFSKQEAFYLVGYTP